MYPELKTVASDKFIVKLDVFEDIFIQNSSSYERYLCLYSYLKISFHYKMELTRENCRAMIYYDQDGYVTHPEIEALVWWAYTRYCINKEK